MLMQAKGAVARLLGKKVDSLEIVIWENEENINMGNM